MPYFIHFCMFKLVRQAQCESAAHSRCCCDLLGSHPHCLASRPHHFIRPFPPPLNDSSPEACSATGLSQCTVVLPKLCGRRPYAPLVGFELVAGAPCFCYPLRFPSTPASAPPLALEALPFLDRPVRDIFQPCPLRDALHINHHNLPVNRFAPPCFSAEARSRSCLCWSDTAPGTLIQPTLATGLRGTTPRSLQNEPVISPHAQCW